MDCSTNRLGVTTGPSGATDGDLSTLEGGWRSHAGGGAAAPRYKHEICVSPDNAKTTTAQYLRGLRDDRYSLQTSIRKLFIAKSDFDPLNPDFDTYNKLSRVVKCKWVQVKRSVDVYHDESKGKAHYKNLTTCGSVWTCPVCAERIQETRRQEIATALDWAKVNGLKPVMITLTAPHYDHQTCKDLLERVSAAHKYLCSGSGWKSFKKEIGFQGMIRSLETLHGDSGWHSHFHIVWLVSEQQPIDTITDFVKKRWEAACKIQNLIPKGKTRAFREHSVKVTSATVTGDYLAKQDDGEYLKVTWGADKELSKGQHKNSRGLLHPFQLAAGWSEWGDDKLADLFVEYASAFKGKAQIFWSAGLKDKCGLKNKSDKEAAETESVEAEKVLSLDSHSWGFVKERSMRSKLLTMVETRGPDSVQDWLELNGYASIPTHLIPDQDWGEKVVCLAPELPG